MVLADSFYYQPVQIDTINTRVNADLFAKEGDANGRGMVVQITENGIIKDTTGITLRLQWSHISVGVSGFTDFEVVDATKGLYKLIYPTSMLHRGRVEAFIRITDNGILSGTRNLLITVERMVGSDETIEAADDFSALQTALTRLSIWDATISGKVDAWDADMAATKQVYIDTLAAAEAAYPQELVALQGQLADKLNENQANSVSLEMLTTEAKTAMTGGSVAVIGSQSIAMEQFSSLIQDDIGKFITQASSPTIGAPIFTDETLTGYGTQTYWYHQEYACTEGQKFKLSFDTNINVGIQAYIYALNASNIIIDDWYPGTAEHVTVTDFEVSVPTGSAKLILLSRNLPAMKAQRLEYIGMASKLKVEEVDAKVSWTFDRMREIAGSVEEVDAKVSWTFDRMREIAGSVVLSQKLDVPYTITDGIRVVYNTNTTAISSDNSIISFNCEAFTQYELKGLLAGTSTTYAIHFYDTSGNVIQALTGLSNPSGVVNVTSPYKAVTCKYTTWKNINYQGVKMVDLDLSNNDTIDNAFVSFATGVKPTFITSTVAPKTTITITLPSINKVSVYAKISHDYLYKDLTNTIVLLNNELLAYNLDTKAFEVGTYATLITGRNNIIALAFNSYGRITYGKWRQYYEEQRISERIALTETSITSLQESGLVNYPAYYEEHVQTKIAETQIVQESYINGDSFIYITDMHVAENKMNSPKLIGYLLKNLGIDKVFFGGDLVTAYGTKEEMFEMAYEGMNGLYSNVIPNGAKLYSMRGNHDLTIKLSAEATTGYTATRPETYNMLMRRQRDYFESVADNLYYYTDNVKQKIRYICLDTCELGRAAEGTTNSWGVAYGVSQAQMDWLVNTALNITETGWTVLVFGHISITPSIPSYSSTLDGINEIMKAIKNKTAVSYTGNGLTINKDFSTFLPEVVGYICGHNHKDRSVTENGVLYISTTCDAYYRDDGIPRTVGTISEGAFEIANLDTTSKYLYMTRVGAGTSRFFNY